MDDKVWGNTGNYKNPVMSIKGLYYTLHRVIVCMILSHFVCILPSITIFRRDPRKAQPEYKTGKVC